MAPHNGDFHFLSDLTTRKIDNSPGTVQVTRVMTTEHLQETDNGLSNRDAVFAGWRHIAEISTSGLILQYGKSTIFRERFKLRE